MAVEEINSAGGINGKRLKILYEDIQSNPQIAVTALRKLISLNKIISAVAGISSAVLAMAPVADELNIVLMNSGGISPKIPQVTGNFVFSNIVDGSIEVKTMASFVFDTLGIKSIAVFCINSAAGIDAKDVFVQQFEQKGGKVFIVETHDPGETDYRTQLTKLKNANPPAIYLASFTQESALILKQAAELGIKTQWFSYAPFEGSDIITIAGKTAEGVIYTSQAFDPNSEDHRIKSFQEKYFKKYGEYAEIYAATFYDGIYLIAEAAKLAVSESGTQIRDGLRKPHGFEGVTGKMIFDSRQVAQKSIIFKIIKDGKFQVYEP